MSEHDQVRSRLTKQQVLTIPNLMSFFRILMIPVFLWLYCGEKNDLAAIGVIAVSGLTDTFDGRIARKYNMVSDFGKFLDPVADKLTQAAMLLCLCFRHRQIVWLFALFAAKELWMFALGLLTLRRKDAMHSAQWHGKLNTAVLEVSAAVLLLFPGLPTGAVTAVTVLCFGMMLLSLALYTAFYLRLLFKKPEEKQ